MSVHLQFAVFQTGTTLLLSTVLPSVEYYKIGNRRRNHLVLLTKTRHRNVLSLIQMQVIDDYNSLRKSPDRPSCRASCVSRKRSLSEFILLNYEASDSKYYQFVTSRVQDSRVRDTINLPRCPISCKVAYNINKVMSENLHTSHFLLETESTCS